MIVKDRLTVEIYCPKAKSKAAKRALDNHWLVWNYEIDDVEEKIMFFDVEPEFVDMLDDYEDVLTTGRMGFRGLDDLRNAIHMKEV